MAASFTWSNDIFKPGRKHFAYFTFNNGIGWVTPGGYFVRDNLTGKIVESQHELPAGEKENARAYLQASFSDYLKR